MSTPMKVLATYGHGTENDFVIIFDPQEKIAITPEITAALCNRDSGIGADGLIRIAKRNGKWFMDYRNADGSVAEMCGNGIRVMARYLVVNGHQKEGIFPIDTRDGLKHLKVPLSGDITVNMGQLTIEDEEVFVTVGNQTWDGYDISIGNPHAVVFVESVADAGDLKLAPQVSPADAYPEGVNVEFVEFGGERELKMRVFERGVGETKSCGTGTCAVALAASLKRGERLPAKWVIYPPGGRLEVEIDGHSNATLTGPAVLLGEHDISKYFAGTPLQVSNE
ncbi:MAG: diaminopimelate epimerase [Candidatus Nanopelagicaceae bacterium]